MTSLYLLPYYVKISTVTGRNNYVVTFNIIVTCNTRLCVSVLLVKLVGHAWSYYKHNKYNQVFYWPTSKKKQK